MSTTGLTEKLNLALTSKNAIKSTLVDRAAIEEAAPFTEYASAIENISTELPDIASWIEYDLPVTMNQPGKYTVDAEHIFFANQNSVTTDNAGLWLFNSVTGEIIRLYDKYSYWNKYWWLNNTKLMIASSSYAAGIYDFEAEAFKIIAEGSFNRITEIDNGILILNNGNVSNSYFVEKNTAKVTTLENMTGSRIVDYTGKDFVIIGSSGTNVPYVLDLINLTTQPLDITASSYYKYAKIKDDIVLITASSSSSSFSGIWIWEKATNTCTKIYTDGYYWNHVVVLDNIVLIRSQKTAGLLKYIIGESEAAMLLTTASAADYNNMGIIDENTAFIGCCGGSNYIYNKTDDSLTATAWTSTYNHKYYETEYGIFMGTGYTSTNAYFHKPDNTVYNFPYLSFTYEVLPTNYGHVLYNVKDGVLIVKYDAETQKTTWKTVGESKQSQVQYTRMLETDTDYYIWSTAQVGEANIVRVSKSDYEDCAEVLSTEDENNSVTSATIINNKIYFCGRVLFIYDMETRTYEKISNDFLGSDQLYLSYEKDTYNNFNFTDLQGIINMETRKVSTIPFRTFLWRNFTFDLYGVTNINNGQQYQFKHPYEKNTLGFADYNYNSTNSKVINNTNLLTGIYSGAIVVCNKE